MDVINKVLANMITMRFAGELREGYENISSSHPSLNSRNNIQTVELTLEDYRWIARRVTELLQGVGHDVTVIYDETDGVRAFVLSRE